MLGSSSIIRVRPGKLADAARLAEVFQESWRHAYRGIIPHLHLESMILRRNRDWWLNALRSGESILVAELPDKKLAGYASFGAARARGDHQGEIYELYITPTCQGLGFGELLFEACRGSLDRRRLDGLVVWALSDNTQALDFYWRRGGRPVARSYDRIGSAKLEKIAFGWR